MLVLVALPTAERRLGTGRTTAAFFTGALAVAVPAFLVEAGIGTGNAAAIARAFMRNAGPSAGCWAVAMALLFTTVIARRRRVAGFVAFSILVVGLLVVPGRDGAERLVAAVAGALLGGWWSRSTPLRRAGRDVGMKVATVARPAEAPSVEVDGSAVRG